MTTRPGSLPPTCEEYPLRRRPLLDYPVLAESGLLLQVLQLHGAAPALAAVALAVLGANLVGLGRDAHVIPPDRGRVTPRRLLLLQPPGVGYRL